MDGRGRVLRTLGEAGGRVSRPMSAERHGLTRQARIADSRRRSTRVRRFLSRHSWIVPGAKAAAIFALATGLVLSGAFDTLMRFATVGAERLSREAGFTVSAVSISGFRELSEGDIRKALGIEEGMGLWQADLAAARERVARLAWVKTVSVTRSAEGRLAVVIEERRPVARWQSQGEFYALDENGAVITRIDSARHLGLFHVVADGAPEAAPALFTHLQKHPALASQVRSAAFIGSRRWNLHFDNQVMAQLPEGDIAAALTLLERLVTEEDLMSRAFQVVDLREPGRVHLRGVSPGAVSDQSGGKI